MLPRIDESVEADLALAVEAIAGAKRLAVACHIGPDGDALGSILAVALSLGPRLVEVSAGWGADEVPVPGQYAFLPGTDLLTKPADFVDADVFLAVDCASADRLGCLGERFAAARVSVNIDHHVSNPRFAQINVVDHTAPSSSELILRLLEGMGLAVSKDVATCLYTGLVTDTGQFAYESVTPRAHAAAGHLIELGVEVDAVAQAVFESWPYGYLKTLGHVLERCELTTDPPLVVSYMTQEDLRTTGVSFDETEGIIDVVRCTRETDVAAVFKELEDGRWKASLRSKGATNVGGIAQRFGGGGHALASGYTSDESLEETIAALRRVLAEGEWSRR